MRNSAIILDGDNIKIDLMLVAFIDENETYFIHSPNLDVTGYGDSQNEALDSFELILREYLSDLKERGNLDKVLERKGFIKKAKITKAAERSIADSLLGAFRSSKMFNSFDFSKEINIAPA